MAEEEADQKGTVPASKNLHASFSKSPMRAEAKDSWGAGVGRENSQLKNQDKCHGGVLESGEDFFFLPSLPPSLLPSR